MVIPDHHLILVFLWLLYCILHTWMASFRFKNYIARITGKLFRYYRLLYSLFAFLTLGGLLFFQYGIKSVPIFKAGIAGYIIGMILLIPGLYIMLSSIWKYFYELSGIQALGDNTPVIHLQENGLHRFVRHPLYLGTLLSVWGAFLYFPLLTNLISCTVIHLYVFIGIKIEEKKLIKEFGDDYIAYSTKVPRLMPRWGVYKAKK